jgi:hypothetical protein
MESRVSLEGAYENENGMTQISIELRVYTIVHGYGVLDQDDGAVVTAIRKARCTVQFSNWSQQQCNG